MTGYVYYYDEMGTVRCGHIAGSTRDMLRECKRQTKRGVIVIRLVTYKYLPKYNASTQVGVHERDEIEAVR